MNINHKFPEYFFRMEENREVNHHGDSVSIDELPQITKVSPMPRNESNRPSTGHRPGSKLALIARDEVVELEARKDYYLNKLVVGNQTIL